MLRRWLKRARQAALAAFFASLLVSLGAAQTPSAAPNSPAATQPPAAADNPSEPSATRHGKVLFQSHGEPPPVEEANPSAPVLSKRAAAPLKPRSASPLQEERGDPVPDLSDRERTSFTVVHYDLDAHLQPASSGLEMRASLAVRNVGTEPLRHIPLQISSTLHWEAASEVAADGARRPVEMVQHTIDTDADHTGKANEAIVTPQEPLAPGAVLRLDVFYAGTLPRSTERLRRIGVAADQAAGVDWDGIGAGGNGEPVALRGFGNVLWYPVVSPQLFLGQGNELFRAVGAMRRRGRGVEAKLRLRVDRDGKSPAAFYFCGRRQELRPVEAAGARSDGVGAGVGTAEWPPATVGFRTMSLFGVEGPEKRVGVLPAGSIAVTSQPQFSSSAGVIAPEKAEPAALPASTTPRSGEALLKVATNDDGALPLLAASAEHVAPLLTEWFGARPLSALTVLDAGGQPFQDGPLLRAPASTLGASSAAGVLAHSMTAAWVQTGEPWMDEGLGQFVELLWTEQTEGRPTALAQMAELMAPVSLAEPALDRARLPKPAPDGSLAPAAKSGPGTGEALVDAESELFYRRKAAAVWWMLRDIAGEPALRQALSAWQSRLRSAGEESSAGIAVAFETLLEKTSGKDLHWFFDDWVLHDRGLPDLVLADVTPRQLPAGQGHDSGWLVAVTVRNDGAAAAEVPLIVRSGSFSSSRRIRVPGFGSATERVLVEAPPTEVVLNDGSTPEVRTTLHSRSIVPVSR